MSADTSYIEVQALTRAVPTLATEGQALKNFQALTIQAVAANGQTLSAGTLNAWFYDPVVAVWARVPALDLVIATSGVQSVAWPALPVIGPRNARYLWATSGLTVSGGTTVTVYQLGFAPVVGDVY